MGGASWRRQSSEVLYVTYQHGLPFNQRVERKDKVKSSSLSTANKIWLHKKPWKGWQESETGNRLALSQTAPSEKEGERGCKDSNEVRECRSQTWAKLTVKDFQTVLKNQQHWVSLLVPINVKTKSNSFSLIFSSGLVVLLADMTQVAAVGGWSVRNKRKPTRLSGRAFGSSHIPGLEGTWQ